MIEMASWNLDAWNQVKEHPLLVSIQLPLAGDWMSTMMEMVDNDVSIIHLISDTTVRPMMVDLSWTSTKKPILL